MLPESLARAREARERHEIGLGALFAVNKVEHDAQFHPLPHLIWIGVVSWEWETRCQCIKVTFVQIDNDVDVMRSAIKPITNRAEGTDDHIGCIDLIECPHDLNVEIE